MDGLELKIVLYLMQQDAQSATLAEIHANAGGVEAIQTTESVLSMMIDGDEGFSLVGDKYVLVGANVTSDLGKSALSETIRLQEAAVRQDNFLSAVAEAVQNDDDFTRNHKLITDFSKLAVWNADSPMDKRMAGNAVWTKGWLGML